MATRNENVDIRFRSTGLRVIKRKIDGMGQAANNATRGVFLLQRAIFVLGGAGAIRALSRQVDMLTNYENRLRLTATSASNLEEVQRRLFQVARESRSSFESVADIYTRTALSVRELGISQQETIRFTESLSKATIISGASSREAHAALIQLGQGMASNTLRGDELRSVLEQLPFVADVIAKSLGVTRGELRELGAEGKISAETILKAFREAEAEIDELFGNTIPTISQALSVATTNWLQFIDSLDDATNVSAKLAQAIIVVSENIEGIAKSLAALAIGFSAVFTVRQIQRIADTIKELRKVGVSVSRLTELEALRAVGGIRRAKASIAEKASREIELTQSLRLIAIRKVEQQQQVLALQFSVKNGLARNIATGQFVSLISAKEKLIIATHKLSIVEGVEASQATRLVKLRGAQVGATNALAIANGRLVAANIASNTAGARLVRRYPVMTGAVIALTKAFRILTATMAANPIGLAIVSVVLVIAAFLRWGNLIKVTADKFVGLKDAAVAAFQLISEKITPIGKSLIDIVGSAIVAVTSLFGQFSEDVLVVALFITEAFYEAFTAIPRTIISVIAGIIKSFNLLPDAAKDVGVRLANHLIESFEKWANKAVLAINFVITSLNELLTFVGADKALEFFGISGQVDLIDPVALSRMKNEHEGAGKAAGEAFMEGFDNAWDATSLEGMIGIVTTALEPIGTAVTDRARLNLLNARSDRMLIELANKRDAERTGEGGDGGKGEDFAEIIAKLEKQIELLQLSSAERKIQEGILKIEKELKRDLTAQENDLAAAALKNLQIAKAQSSVLESIIGPREKAAEQLAALNALYEQGRIGIEDYTNALRDMQAAADEASGTLAGGFRAAISGAIMSAKELGGALGGLVVDAAGRAADAIVEFATTGKFNIRQFFYELFAQLLKLAANQLFLQLIGSMFGVPIGGGNAAGLGGVLKGLLGGAAAGGSILPSGPGSTDTQIVSFKKRPDERVDILTPGQQQAQRNNMQGGQGDSSQIVVSPVLNVAVVIDENDIVSAFSGKTGDTFIVRGIERNSNSVRKVISG